MTKVEKKLTARTCCFFKKRKKQYVEKSMLLLEKLSRIKTQHEMKVFMESVDHKFISFLRECIYNSMINTHTLFSNDQIAFLYDSLQSNEKNVLYLYQFVFQDMTRKNKCVSGCKCYQLIVILITMLLPIFKIIMLE